MRSAPFWDITQRVVVIPYRRFGTIYWSHLEWPKFTLEDGIHRPSRKVGTLLPLYTVQYPTQAETSKGNLVIYLVYNTFKGILS
jgi:hypothetical protein